MRLAAHLTAHGALGAGNACLVDGNPMCSTPSIVGTRGSMVLRNTGIHEMSTPSSPFSEFSAS